MEPNQTPIHIELEGEVLEAVEVAPGLAILRSFPSVEACRFGDLVAFDPNAIRDVPDEGGQSVACHPFLRVEQSGGYRQYRSPCEGGDLNDVTIVARELWKKKVAVQAFEDERGDEWLEIAVPKDADLWEIAVEIMDLCSLIGLEAWPYELMLQESRLEEVGGLIREVTVGGPRGAYLYYVLARALEDLDRFDEALENYRQAVERDPDSVILQENLAICLANAGRKSEADTAFRKALERFPEDPTLQQNYSRFLEGEEGIVWLRLSLN